MLLQINPFGSKIILAIGVVIINSSNDDRTINDFRIVL